MVAIKGAAKPDWIEIEEDGFALFGRYADGLDASIAETRALNAQVEFAQLSKKAAEYGLEEIDWTKPLGEGAGSIMEGAGRYLYATELIMQCATAWSGVTLDGEPAPFDRKHVCSLMRQRIEQEPTGEFAWFGNTYAFLVFDALLGAHAKGKAEGKP